MFPKTRSFFPFPPPFPAGERCRVRRLLVDEMDREKLFSFSKEFGISSFYEIVNKYIIMYNIYGNSI